MEAFTDIPRIGIKLTACCVVGSQHEYIGLDFYIDHSRKRVLLHAVLHNEHDSFARNFQNPRWYPYNEAIDAARELEGEAVSWCVKNDVKLEHEEWGTEPEAFYKAVSKSVLQAMGGGKRYG